MAIDLVHVNVIGLTTIKYVYLTDFSEICESDHRGIVCELSEEALWGSTIQDHGTLKTKLLNSKNEKRKGKYLQYLEEQLIKRNIYNRIMCISKTPIQLVTKDWIDELDSDITSSMLKAERKLIKFSNRHKHWIAEIENLRIYIQYLQKCIKVRLGGRWYEEDLKYLESKFVTSTEISEPLSIKDPIERLVKEILNTKKLIKKIQQKGNKREEELTNKVEKNMILGDKK